MTKREELDKLVAWFEKNNPERGTVIRVKCGPKALARMLGIQPPKEGECPRERKYRGRTILATGADVTRTP